MKQIKIKRKLLASLYFDLAINETAFLVPVVNLWWNLEDNKKPFKLTLRWGWLHVEVDYEYERLMKYLQKYTLYDLAKVEIMERIPTYKGKFVIDGNYYQSETWRAIRVAKNREQVEAWFKKKQL